MNAVAKRLRMPSLCAFAVAGLGVAAPAHADNVDFSGKWAVSGHMIARGGYVMAMPICNFQQQDSRISGFCRGPNGAGEASGLANGAELSFQWRVTPTNQLGLRGVASFNCALGPDGVVRGQWTTTVLPGAVGDFTAQRP